MGPQEPLRPCEVRSGSQLSPRIYDYVEKQLLGLDRSAHLAPGTDCVKLRPNGRASFAKLRGTETEFGEESNKLARRLYGLWSRGGNIKPSILVTSQFEVREVDEELIFDREAALEGPVHVAILKLDAYDPGAHIDHDGKSLLEAVEEVLDLPRRLSKGALWPRSSRRAGDGTLIVVDDAHSQYFLDLLDAQRVLAGGPSKRKLKELVQRTVKKSRRSDPAAADAAGAAFDATLEALADQGEVTPVEMLDRIDMLHEGEVSAVLAATEDAPTTPGSFDPKKLPATVMTSGFNIKSTLGEIDDRLSWEPVDHGWLITIRVDTEPLTQVD